MQANVPGVVAGLALAAVRLPVPPCWHCRPPRLRLSLWDTFPEQLARGANQKRRTSFRRLSQRRAALDLPSALLGGSVTAATACASLRKGRRGPTGSRGRALARARPSPDDDGGQVDEDRSLEATLSRAQQSLGKNGQELQGRNEQVLAEPPKAKGSSCASEKDDSQVRSVVAMLQKHAQDAEMRFQQEQLRREKLEMEVLRARRIIPYILRQAEDFQIERDEALDKYEKTKEELDRTRRDAENRRIGISKEVEDALRRVRSRFGGAEGGEARAPPLADMDQEALRAECARLGLPQDGGISRLRVRLRAARLQQKGSQAE